MKQQKIEFDEETVFSYDMDIYPDAENKVFHGSHSKVLEFDESEIPENSSMYYFSNRLILCFVAMALLWMTSLQISAYIAQFYIAIPALSNVINHCEYAYDRTLVQKSLYEDCVSRELETCNRELQKNINVEKKRIGSIYSTNLAYSSNFSYIQSNCSSLENQVVTLLSAWLSGGVNYTVPYKTSCSANKKATVMNVIGDNSQNSGEVYTSSTDYVTESNNRVIRLAEYSQALNDYNKEYVSNKTKALKKLAFDLSYNISFHSSLDLNATFVDLTKSFQMFINCASLNNDTALNCIYSPSLYSVYAEYAQYSVNSIDFSQNQIEFYTDQTTKFLERANQAFNDATNFYNSVRGAQGIINWISKTFSVGSFCGKSSPDFCSFSADDFWTYPPNLIPIYPIDYPYNAKILWKSTKYLESIAKDSILSSSNKLKNQLNNMMNSMVKAIDNADFSPHDYHPPKYSDYMNSTDEISQQTNSSSSFLASLQNSLYNKTQRSVSSVVSSITSSSYDFSWTNTVESKFSTIWHNFDYESISFGILLSSFHSLQGVLVFFDYIYRVLQSIRLIVRFWNRGVVKFPSVSLPSKAIKVIQTKWMTYFQWFMRLLPFIWFQILIFVILLVIIIWITATLLVPEYQGYVSACVHHSSNNTFISRNLAAGAINAAAVIGNTKLSAGINAYNLNASTQCNTEATSSQSQYNDLIKELQNLNETLYPIITDLEDISDCIDIPTFDSKVLSACCSSIDYLSLSSDNFFRIQCLQTKISSDLTCPLAIQKLFSSQHILLNDLYSQYYCTSGQILYPENQNSSKYINIYSDYQGLMEPNIFECDVIPECTMTCSGPDTRELTMVTNTCSCYGEWYWNGNLLSIVLSVMIYVIINVSRFLICHGLIAVNWHFLSRPMFRCSMDCDDQGNLISLNSKDLKEFNIMKKTKEISKILKDKIAEMLRSFVIKGYIKIFIGLCINIAWIIFIVFAKNNIKYNP